jgi:hypothetical protein
MNAGSAINAETNHRAASIFVCMPVLCTITAVNQTGRLDSR